MLELLNGREHFYQWDTNQKVKIDDNEVLVVQYDNGTGDALVCPVYEYEGQRVADVPNIMLQMPIVIKAYAACEDCVRYARAYKVEQRSRPDDYIYTETETLKYSALLAMIEETKADLDTFISEAAATDELLLEKLEADTKQLQSEINNQTQRIDYIKNTELPNHSGWLDYLKNKTTNNANRIEVLEQSGGTGGSNPELEEQVNNNTERIEALENKPSAACECKTLRFKYNASTKMVEVDKPFEEVAKYTLDELRQMDITLVYDGYTMNAAYYGLLGSNGSDGYTIYFSTAFDTLTYISSYYVCLWVNKNTLTASIRYPYNIAFPRPSTADAHTRYQLTAYNGTMEWTPIYETEEEEGQNIQIMLYESNGAFTYENEQYSIITPAYLIEAFELNVMNIVEYAVVNTETMTVSIYKINSIDMANMTLDMSNGINVIHMAADGSLSYKEADNGGEYELIETIVCDGTYGNMARTGLNYKEVKIYIHTTAATAANSIGVEMRNDAGLFGYAWIGNAINTGERWAYVYGKSDGKEAYTEYTTPATATYGTAGVCKTSGRLNAETPIKRIGIYASGSGAIIPAGTTFEIWGVRA